MGLSESEAKAKRLTARARASAIGPVGSAVMLGGKAGGEVFFKVKWGRMKRVMDVAQQRGEEMMDSTTRWTIHGEPGERYSVSLDIEWPEVPEQVYLFFPLPKWRTELDLVAHGGHIVNLCPVQAKGREIVERSLSIQAETDLLGFLHSL